jgi:hypothetical protein
MFNTPWYVFRDSFVNLLITIMEEWVQHRCLLIYYVHPTAYSGLDSLVQIGRAFNFVQKAYRLWWSGRADEIKCPCLFINSNEYHGWQLFDLKHPPLKNQQLSLPTHLHVDSCADLKNVEWCMVFKSHSIEILGENTCAVFLCWDPYHCNDTLFMLLALFCWASTGKYL